MIYEEYERRMKKARTVKEIEELIKGVFVDMDVNMTHTKLILRLSEIRAKELEKEDK